MKALETARALLLCGIAVLATGCGNSDGLLRVSGEVKFDGELIENGRIQFRSTEGDMKAYSSPIRDGKYEVQIEPGESRVQIYASRPIPGVVEEINPGEFDQPGEMYIPEKYNSRSELTVSISESTDQQNFDLTP